MPATEYHITSEFIELNQLLKLCGLAESGGAGAALVSEGNVEVDGQAELRKRCKIRPGQVVRLGDTEITVLTADAAAMASNQAAQAAKAKLKFDKRVNKKNAAKAAAWLAKTKPSKKLPLPGGARKGPKARSKENALAAAKARGVTTVEAPWTARTTKKATAVAKPPTPPADARSLPTTATPRIAKVRPNVFAEKAAAHRRRKQQP